MLVEQTLRAFSDELVKIGKERQERQEKPKKRSLKETLLGAVAGGAGAYGGLKATSTAMFASLNAAPKSFTPFDILRSGHHMGVYPNAYLPISGGPENSAMAVYPGQFFGTNSAVLAPWRGNEAVTAHEVGHIKNLKTVGEGALTAGAHLRNVGLKTFIPLSIWAGAEDKPSYTPGLLQAALMTPTLLDEGAASIRATGHMIKRHGLGKGLLKSLPLVPAFGTYAAIAGAPLAVTAIRKYMDKKKHHDSA